jgi:predicted O-methyltransferase YrrM
MSELISEYDKYEDKKNEYVESLKQIIIDSKENPEGNIFYPHKTLNLLPVLKAKQANLFWCGKQATTKLCEIGFNAGHSAMVMLLGREDTPLDFTIFDIGEHKYTNPCYNYIKSKFPSVSFEFVEGDSTKTMPSWISSHPELIGSYDVVHLDGGHSEHCILNDMKNSDILVKKGGIIIIDDTNISHINKYVEKMLTSGKYEELKHIVKTTQYLHRIIKKIV